MKKLKLALCVVLAIVMVLPLVACGKKDDGKYLSVMLGTNVMSLDTHEATDGDSFEVIADCIDGLMQMDADGKAVLAIAESYEVSADGKTYTFKLRDAKWSNGDAVTANDFVFAWRRIAKLNGEYAYMLSDIGQIKNAAEIMEGKAEPETLGVTGRASVFDSSADLIEYLKENPLSDRTVLLKGSNGTRLQGVVKAL